MRGFSRLLHDARRRGPVERGALIRREDRAREPSAEVEFARNSSSGRAARLLLLEELTGRVDQVSV